MATDWFSRITAYSNTAVNNAPLVVFRVVFGVMMVGATIRFWLNGWIEDLYITPKYHFTYHGLEWIKNPGDPGIYMLFGIIAFSALCMALGLFYRLAALAFFVSFTYVELIDVTNYLNHYYFISIVAFLMMLLPANRRFSLDVKLGWTTPSSTCPRWAIGAIRLQLGLVYFFAGIAKINYHWLIQGQPLAVWLRPRFEMPLIGPLFLKEWFILAMAWFGMIYDILIPFLLLWRKTRIAAYIAVLFFHIFTYLLFPIGMFPFIMILSTLIFFPGTWHQRLLGRIERQTVLASVSSRAALIKPILVVFFLVQVAMPFRYLLYDGNLFWHEQGFRFSWRVMLMEKYGTGTFYVSDPDYPGRMPVNNCNYLSPQQEKLVFSQPDLILQYAEIIRKDFKGRTFIEGNDTIYIDEPQVYADIVVSMNGYGHRQYVSPQVNLSALENGFYDRSWLEEAP
jgi:hypothetical protein